VPTQEDSGSLQDDLSASGWPSGAPDDGHLGPAGERRALVISAVLDETHTRTSGFKDLYRHLERCFPEKCKLEARLRDGSAGYTSLSKALSPSAATSVLVFGNPQRPLSPAEQQRLVVFVLDGGHLVVCASAGGLPSSNFNEVLELFGIKLQHDAVLRCAMHKYYHPKQVFVSDGMLNRAIASAAHEERHKGEIDGCDCNGLTSHGLCANATKCWLDCMHALVLGVLTLKKQCKQLYTLRIAQAPEQTDPI
jgi:hypothetical protein